MVNKFDEKNQKDYEENTKLLVNAIDKIKATPSLSPSIAELSRLTGLHRNSISNRRWPNEKLKELKNERKITAVTNTHSQKQPKSAIKDLEDKLNNAKKELVYWFNKNMDNERKIKQLEQNLNRMSTARSDYENMLNQEREITYELTKQLNLMRDLLP